MESRFCSHWRKSWHQVLGLNREARIPPCSPLKGDSLNSRAVWPLVGVGDLAPDAISVTKARGCGLGALSAAWKVQRRQFTLTVTTGYLYAI